LFIPIVAIISLYVVYLSIDIMKEANKFSKGLLVLDFYKNKIKLLDDQSNKKVFSPALIMDVSKNLQCDVSSVTFRNFVMPLNTALFDILASTDYPKLLKKAEAGIIIEKEEAQRINPFLNSLVNLKNQTGRIFIFYRVISFLYWEIFLNIELDVSQKRHLFQILDELSSEYTHLAQRIINKESEYEELINMKIFIVTYWSGKFSDITPLLEDDFTNPFERIQEAKKLLYDQLDS
jgi:hypothetical protein